MSYVSRLIHTRHVGAPSVLLRSVIMSHRQIIISGCMAISCLLTCERGECTPSVRRAVYADWRRIQRTRAPSSVARRQRNPVNNDSSIALTQCHAHPPLPPQQPRHPSWSSLDTTRRCVEQPARSKYPNDGVTDRRRNKPPLEVAASSSSSSPCWKRKTSVRPSVRRLASVPPPPPLLACCWRPTVVASGRVSTADRSACGTRSATPGPSPHGKEALKTVLATETKQFQNCFETVLKVLCCDGPSIVF